MMHYDWTTWPRRPRCEICGQADQTPHVLAIGCCIRCAAPLRQVPPPDIDVERSFLLAIYGDHGDPGGSAVEWLMVVCARAKEIDAFVERVLAWPESIAAAQFMARARTSDFSPHQRLLAALGTAELRRRIECVAQTAKALLELERRMYQD